MRLLSRLVISTVLASPFLTAHAQIDQAKLNWMRETLAGWETTCREDLHISPEPLPWIIFYDEVRAWHVHPDRKLLPPHRPTKHSLRFAGRLYQIYELDNNGKLWVPGRDPLNLTPQGTAMPYG